jgi:histidyl-tRNA synthetase
MSDPTPDQNAGQNPNQNRNSGKKQKKNKPNKAKDRVRPRLPRGLQDRDAADLRAQGSMIDTVRGVFERYGFDPVETPMIEFTDALGKFLPDSDRPNEGVFSFQDDDEQWLSLRYDLTAPLARYVAENRNDLTLPYRSYRVGPVFRNEKPGPGRFRQFMQFDADTVGSSSPAADAEICMMMADVMEAIGIPRGDYVIRVNNRKVLDGVMEAIGVTDEAQKLAVLRAIDKLDKFGVEGVKLLLGEGRKDESGDFTKGAGLDEGDIGKITALITTKFGEQSPQTDRALEVSGEKSAFRNLSGENLVHSSEMQIGRMSHDASRSTLGEEGMDALREIDRLVRAAGYGPGRIIIDPSVVRGLEYYTGPVFEAELTFETVNEKGETARYGSVAGGGRYDGLVARFGGQAVPATGFSLGVSRLMAALKALGKLDTDTHTGPIVVTVMDRDRMADYQRFVSQLRNAGLKAELFLGNPKQFGKQLDYADKRGSPCVIIQGSDEAANNQVVVKDMIAGAQIDDTMEDREEFQRLREATQVTVPEDTLVETVRAVLAKHGLETGGEG